MTKLVNETDKAYMAYKFKDLGQRAEFIATISIKELNDDGEEIDERTFSFAKARRRIYNLYMFNPPGIAIEQADGSITIIKWPKAEEMVSCDTIQSDYFKFEVRKGNKQFTYVLAL